MIPAAAFDFLRRLAADNERAWFETNRAADESAVRQPVAALVACVSGETARRGLPLEGDPERSMFRIDCDTRFSNDRWPAKSAKPALLRFARNAVDEAFAA